MIRWILLKICKHIEKDLKEKYYDLQCWENDFSKYKTKELIELIKLNYF